MTRDDIIRIAREQGLPETEVEGVFMVNSDDLGRMLAAEREACAKLVENFERNGNWITKEEAAKAIRARGEK